MAAQKNRNGLADGIGQNRLPVYIEFTHINHPCCLCRKGRGFVCNPALRTTSHPWHKGHGLSCSARNPHILAALVWVCAWACVLYGFAGHLRGRGRVCSLFVSAWSVEDGHWLAGADHYPLPFSEFCRVFQKHQVKAVQAIGYHGFPPLTPGGRAMTR